MDQTERDDRPGPVTTPADLRARGLELLEFPRVRERLAAHCTFVLGREEALALTPSDDADTVARRHHETEEARRFLAGGGTVDLSSSGDVRVSIQRADKGGVLTGVELREIAGVLAAARVTRSAFQRRQQEAPMLAAVAERLPDLRDLEEKITRSVSPYGDVEDGASPLLRDLRGQARIAYGRLEESLHRIIRSTLGRDALQESLVTERNGRLVLPVKVEARRRLPGLVHDISDSGATVFVEPLATVGPGNRWRELQLAEAREVERVLKALSTSVAERADDSRAALGLLAHLDLALAKGHYARALGATMAATHSEAPAYARLVEARHPLLRGGVVPISLELGASSGEAPGGGGARREPGAAVIVVTGPNAGGKTVALKTVGILSLMHQAGLQVPAAQGTVLPLFDGVYADIGDQQSIERSLSTFTSHILNIRSVMAASTPRSLVLLDEVGSSTDPEEGAALAKAVLQHFLERRTPTVVTTHQREVAAYAQETAGLANASVELDPTTLAPTYRLTMGLPGRSYALAIASRMGLPARTLEQARALLSPTHRSMEDMLAGVQEERKAAAEMRAEAEAAAANAERLRQEAEAQVERLQALEAEMHQGLRTDLQARADALLDRLRAAERALASAPAAPAVPIVERVAEVRQAAAEVQAVRREVRSRSWRPPRQDRAAWVSNLAPGDAVQVRGFPTPATLLSSADAQGTVEVALGALRARVPVEHLMHPAPGTGASPSSPARASTTWGRRPQTHDMDGEGTGESSSELDLRGLRVEEALDRLEPFLDQALLQGRSRVRVIHGAGTGALRAALRDRLSRHQAARSWAPDEEARGDGATVVELV